MNETTKTESNAPTQQVAPNNELLSGFATAEELIGYCEIHCTTDRALFNGKQIIDILVLAGYDETTTSQIDPQEWMPVHDDMARLCRMARARMDR